MRLLLDTNVLGQICHPRRHQDVRAWFARAVAAQARAEEATVVTANARHLARLVPVLDWTAVPTGSG